MVISNQTRKILWRRSGDRCAVCQRRLVRHATESHLESAIGSECHIVAPELDGPRGDVSLTVEQRDEYSNLILLCKVHHQLIDAQPHTYPVDKLREIKRRHEAWIYHTFNLPQPRVERSDLPQPSSVEAATALVLYRVETGSQLMSLLRGSHASRFHQDSLDCDRTELANQFLQGVQEQLDRWDAIASQTRTAISSQLDRAIYTLEANDLLVYAGQRREPHAVENRVFGEWQVGYLLVVNQVNPIAANRSEALERLMGFKLATDREFASYILIQLEPA